LLPDAAARAAFIIATGAELRATVLAERPDISPGFCHLRGTKRTARLRDVPIVLDWQRSLLAYTLENAAGTEGKLFAGSGDEFRWVLRYACRRAGVPHTTPNDLRRTYATELHAAGARLATLAPTLGHADTRMLERVYAVLPPALIAERLRAELGVGQDRDRPASNPGTDGIPGTALPSEKVPRGGIEPPTRGFSVPCQKWRAAREARAISASEKSHRDRIGTVRIGSGSRGRVKA
jgi:hypothetical protein